MTRWQVSYHGTEDADVEGATAVVIDVIRAFTTAAWAFERGVERIVMVQGLDEALTLKARLPGSLAMKDGEPEPGFEVTNSPAHMQRRGDLAGKTLVQRTTHGTQGAVAARGAGVLYCAGFVVAAATARAIRRAAPGRVAFIVTDRDPQTDEDQACAEYIAALLEDPATDPAPYLERAARSKTATRITQSAKDGALGADVADVGMTLEVNRFDFAMRAADENGLLVLRKHAI
jgi:2-phosphosulfolactate phosphatase